MWNGLESYRFPTGEDYGLRMEALEGKKHVGGVGGVLTTVKFAVVPVTFYADLSYVALALICQDYDCYRKRTATIVELGVRRPARKLI